MHVKPGDCALLLAVPDNHAPRLIAQYRALERTLQFAGSHHDVDLIEGAISLVYHVYDALVARTGVEPPHLDIGAESLPVPDWDVSELRRYAIILQLPNASAHEEDEISPELDDLIWAAFTDRRVDSPVVCVEPLSGTELLVEIDTHAPLGRSHRPTERFLRG